MHLKILLAVVAIASLGAATAQEACERSCGNVTITFPFGTGEGCYYDPDFLITCNRSSGQPIAYLGDSNIDILNMSTSKSEMEIRMFVGRDCYNSSGPVDKNKPTLTLANLRISPKNKFVVIGCDSYGYFEGIRGNDSDIRTGCDSTCGESSTLTNGSCSGVGCCEVAVPEGLESFEMGLNSFNNHTDITDLNPCSYAFFVQQEKFNFSTTYLAKFESEQMPMLLNWAIGNLTCDEAKGKDKFLCTGKTECDPEYEGPGYRCRCRDGYEGNPYVNCTNINECEIGTHDCKHECHDTPGNYTCTCPKGYYGDGTKNGTGCTATQSTVIKIVAGISTSATFFLIFVAWLYLLLKKRKFILLREKFFKQNGGIMLQQRISGDGSSRDQAKVFTIEELKRATNNYDEGRIIGKGGYGTVYKGILADNRVVAIKKSKLADHVEE